MNASPMSGLWPLRVAELRMSADQYEMRLVARGRAEIFAGREDGRRRADRAHRRHVNMLVASAMSEPADPALVLMKV